MGSRYGKMLALGFSSSLGARASEHDFKKINFDGKYAEIWSESPRALMAPAP